MLYISRSIGRNRYGVMDTDDGVEQVVTRSELSKYVLDDGLNIVGCELVDYGNGMWYVLATPYSPEVDASRSKMNVLKGIDYNVTDGVLISMNLKKCRVDTTIRLSEICSTIDDFAFISHRNNQGSNKVTLVLDDNVKAKSEHSFEGLAGGNNVILDLREVTYKPTVRRAYAGFIGIHAPYREFEIPILDNEPRRSQFMAVRLINIMPYTTVKPGGNVLEQEQHVLSLYKEKMLSLSNEQLRIEFRRANRDGGITARDIWDNKMASLSNLFEWTEEAITENCVKNTEFILSVGDALLDCTLYNITNLSRLINYMKYWRRDKELCELWRSICVSAIMSK